MSASTSTARQSVFKTRHVFVALDGLRGVAALSVVLFHYSPLLGGAMLPNAFLAVDFFFVLIGFVLAHAYEERLRADLGFSAFMRQRLIRLWPLYLLGLAMSVLPFVGTGLSGHPDPRQPLIFSSCLFSMFFLPTPALFSPDHFVFPLNVPAWTLSLEIMVNALYAISCRQLTTRRLIAFGLLALAGLLAAVLYYRQLNIGGDWPTYIGGWARVLWSFFAGILAYRLFVSGKWPKLPSGAGILLVLALIGVFALPPASLALSVFGITVLFPLIILLAANITLDGLPQRSAAWAGAVSYALYIVHVPLGQLLSAHYKQASVVGKAYWPNLLLWVTLAVCMAWALDVIYDIPLRRFLNRSPKK